MVIPVLKAVLFNLKNECHENQNIYINYIGYRYFN